MISILWVGQESGSSKSFYGSENTSKDVPFFVNVLKDKYFYQITFVQEQFASVFKEYPCQGCIIDVQNIEAYESYVREWKTILWVGAPSDKNQNFVKKHSIEYLTLEQVNEDRIKSWLNKMSF
jgi:hypothetical protein